MFYDIVRELRGAGATVLLSTHALAEVATHVDRVVVMKQGRKIADGTLAQLRQSIGVTVRIVLTLDEPAPAGALPAPWKQIGHARFARVCPELDTVNDIQNIRTEERTVGTTCVRRCRYLG